MIQVWYEYKLKFAIIKTKALRVPVFILARKPFYNLAPPFLFSLIFYFPYILSLLQLCKLLKGRGFLTLIFQSYSVG